MSSGPPLLVEVAVGPGLLRRLSIETAASSPLEFADGLLAEPPLTGPFRGVDGTGCLVGSPPLRKRLGVQGVGSVDIVRGFPTRSAR